MLRSLDDAGEVRALVAAAAAALGLCGFIDLTKFDGALGFSVDPTLRLGNDDDAVLGGVGG